MDWNAKQTIVATCAKGIPDCLNAEMSVLGFKGLEVLPGGVKSYGSLTDTMSLNLNLRSAIRVLFCLKEFKCQNPEDLYKNVNSINWEEIIDEAGYLCVTSSVDNPTIKNWQFANVKTKDAIVDRIMKIKNRRPDSGSDTTKTVVFLYWKNDTASVYIDTSAEPLSKRDYRRIPMDAPMQESLAAAAVLSTGYNGTQNFINPMCGAGTLAIEAALIALAKPAGILRTNFGFMHIKGFDDTAWQKIRQTAQKNIRQTIAAKIIATDINPKAIEAAKTNARLAGVENYIDFSVCDYSQTPLTGKNSIIMINPGYGIRVGENKELEPLYKGIGDFFKQKCAGSTGYVFSGNFDLLKKVGLKANRKLPFYNGPIECRLCEYQLYEGKRDQKKEGPA